MNREEKLQKITEGLNTLNKIRTTYAVDGRIDLGSVSSENKRLLFSDILKVISEFGSFGGAEYGRAIERAGLMTEAYRNLKRHYREAGTADNTRTAGAGIRQTLEYLRPALSGMGGSVISKSVQIYDILRQE